MNYYRYRKLVLPILRNFKECFRFELKPMTNWWLFYFFLSFFFLNVNVIKYVNSKLAGFVYVLCKLFITIKYSQSKHVPFSLISIMIWIYKVRKLRVTSRLYEIFGKFLQQLMIALFSYFNLEYQTLCNEEIKWLTCRASYWELIVWSVVKKNIAIS